MLVRNIAFTRTLTRTHTDANTINKLTLLYIITIALLFLQIASVTLLLLHSFRLLYFYSMLYLYLMQCYTPVFPAAVLFEQRTWQFFRPKMQTSCLLILQKFVRRSVCINEQNQ